MITRDKFELIEKEVEEVIKELFAKAIGSSFEDEISKEFNNYFLLLNNCVLINNEIKFSKNEALTDSDRSNFYIDFLEKNYTFSNQDKRIEDDTYRFFIELMIFTHFWESKYIINLLAQIAGITIGEEFDLEIYKKHPYYDYDLKNPSTTKKSNVKIYKYITERIKKKFINSNLKIGQLFPKLYNSQIRNAFAHSDFYFSDSEKKIYFKNYKPNKNHSIESITFDEWTERFCYTFLFSYLLEKKMKMDYETFAEESIKRGNEYLEIKIDNQAYLVRYDKLKREFILKKK